MSRAVAFFLAVWLGLGLGNALAGDTPETTLKVVVLSAQAGAPTGNVVPHSIVLDPPAPAALEVNADVVLDATIEPCLSNPQACVGENFTVPDPKDPTIILSYGCSDMMDNDSDGTTDAEDVDCRSVQGFSFSIATDACFGINRATTRGTVSDLNTRVPGIRDPEGSFEKTEVVSPANNGGQQGAVCAVVFSFTRPIFLPQDSRQVVCILRGDVDRTGASAPGVCTAPCLLRILDPTEDGLAGSGEPVKTAITVGGDTEIPGLCNATIQFCGRVAPPEPQFIRCDANDDAKNDIADAVWIVNDLLNSGPPTRCPDAGDCNDDGLGPDVSDAVYCIAYQFNGGPRPPAPFPTCGSDPSADSIPECIPPDSCPQ